MLSPPVTNVFVMQPVHNALSFPSFLSLAPTDTSLSPTPATWLQPLLYIPVTYKLIPFFKCKIFHIKRGKPAAQFLKVAILARNQSRDRRSEMGSWCSVKHRRSAAQMSRGTAYLKPWLGLQGLFLSIFINFMYMHIYFLLHFFHICKTLVFCCILKCGLDLFVYQMDWRDCVLSGFPETWKT